MSSLLLPELNFLQFALKWQDSSALCFEEQFNQRLTVKRGFIYTSSCAKITYLV
jgi:hypothetical protein